MLLTRLLSNSITKALLLTRCFKIRIRKVFYQLVSGQLTPNDFRNTTRRHVTKVQGVDDGFLQLDHCFDYIQEGIRCAASLDMQYPTSLHGVRTLTGERMCKDWVSETATWQSCPASKITAELNTQGAVLDLLERFSFDASMMTL